MKQKSYTYLLLCLLVALLLTPAVGIRMLRASSPTQDELDAVWRRVQQSGAYHFGVDMTQTETPQATVVNAGRQSTSHTYYLQGETDLAAASLHLRIWSQGGSALLPDSGMELAVQGDTARARRGHGAWQEVDNFTGLFAPGGDFLTFARTAKHIVRHEPELRNTVAGAIEVTRFTFDVDGRAYALQMVEQMRAQATRAGLPANVHFDLPKVYAQMTGTGELWVGADGLPLRQTFALQFPEAKDSYVSSTAVTVDFSNFAPLPPPGWSNRAARLLRTGLDALATPGSSVTLLMTVLALLAAALVIVQRRARPVYAAVVIAVIASMVAVPLMNGRQIYAYSTRQEARQKEQATARDKQQLAETARAAQKTTDFDPHRDPLEVAQQAAAASAAAQQTVSNDLSDSRYLDPSCESDPNGDLDGDTLTNLEECLLGTLPDEVDTDHDGVNDNVEVAGFRYNGQTWYTNPLDIDSNKDGLGDGQEWLLDANGDKLPDDTDGDGTPDLWDDDNDGDGVPDDLDLSVYVQTGGQAAAGVGATKLFNQAQPLQLTFGQLKAGELVNVEFQLEPTNPDHLWYTRNVLDWPVNDRQGQIQDADGATFYDLDNSLSPSPNANGDMRMVPMLEIEMPIDSANLPPSQPCTPKDGETAYAPLGSALRSTAAASTCYPLLQQFGVSVQQTSENTLAAYVPLQLVSNGKGESNVGFYGRMLYQASGLWQGAHKVRLVWVIEALNDICETYKDNVCTEYSQYNVLQIVQTYYDDWYLTGLTLTEERGTDTALIYEDPAQVDANPDSFGAPLYLDTLYGLLYGLDHSFLAARDCDSVDANGACVGNGVRDITVDEIARRFDHATNAGVSDQERWGTPNVLSVAAHHYASADLAALDTTVTQTVQILDNVFTNQWSDTDPITPTIMLASEQSFRAFNFDKLLDDAANMSWNGNGLTIDLPQSGDHAVEVETIASLKWTPYAYDPIDGWAAADITAFWDVLTAQLSDRFDGLTSDEADTYHTMSQILYLAMNQGTNASVQIGDKIYAQVYQTADVAIEKSIATSAAKMVQTALKLYFKYTQALQEAALAIRLQTIRARESFDYFLRPQGPSLSRFWAAQVAQFGKWKAIAAVVFVFLLVALVLTALIAEYIVGDTWAGWNTIGQVAILALTLIFTLIMPIVQTLQTARNLASVGAISLAAAVGKTLASAQKLAGAQKWLGIIGLVIAIAVAIGIFLWAWASGKVSPGEIAFNQLLAQTIAAIIIAIIIFAISLTVVGAILLAIITIVDLILQLAGSDFTIMGSFAEVLAGLIYRFGLKANYDIDTGSLHTKLADPALGFVAGNQLAVSLPITTTLSRYANAQDLRRHSLAYGLDKSQRDIKTRLDDRANDYTLSVKDYDSPFGPYQVYEAQVVDAPTYTQTLQAGVNEQLKVYLNSGYALLGTECWWIFCKNRTVDGSSSEYLGKIAVVDVLPATLDEFVNVSSWGRDRGGAAGGVRFLDPDGDGLLPTSAGGLDPNNLKWDTDGDGLDDGYEVFVRSRPASEGGVNFDPTLADSDGDGVRDDVERRYGTNPGRADSDGDGLSDAAEVPPAGGWSLPFRYNPANQTVTETHVWSDPLQADVDGDGLSDLFERTQLTCPTCNPWADPSNPRVYNANVWNESPVALYITDDSTGGFVAPGATVAYTTTTQNNLGPGQELVGELSLAVPDGVNGGSLAAPVAINNNESASLVSRLSFASQNTASYDLTSRMNLTNFFETRWTWDAPGSTSASPQNNSVLAVAASSLTGWNGSNLVVTREQASSTQTIVAHVVDSDGTVLTSRDLASGFTIDSVTDPAVACNRGGVCMVVWGQFFFVAGFLQRAVRVLQLDGSLSNARDFSIALTSLPRTTAIRNAAVATSGSDFLVAWARSATDSPDATRVEYTRITVDNGAGYTRAPAVVNGAQVVAAAWNGADYTLAWTDNNEIVWRNGALNSNPADDPIYSVAGDGWPRDNDIKRPPVLNYDEISGQTLLAYRSPSGELVARMVDNDTRTPFTLASAGLSGVNVTVALAADRENGGWIAAWSPAGGGNVAYRAISPAGALRGDVNNFDQNALTTVALACSRPRALLELPFDEAAGATLFQDVSGNGRNAVCADSCPQSGVSGRMGNAAAFNGSDQALRVDGIDLVNRSFTLSAWLRYSPGNSPDGAVFSQGAMKTGEVGKNVRMGVTYPGNMLCLIHGTNTLVQAPVPDDQWHHWACTFDKTSQRLTLYRDGLQVSTQTTGAPFTGTGPLYIGRVAPGSIAPFYLTGALDTVMVVDRALAPEEIAEIAQGAAAAYSLDEPAGAEIFVNAIGSGLNGRCESAATCPTMGAPGAAYTAAAFDGQDDHIAIGTQDNSLALANSSFTLAAWARRAEAGQGHMILSEGQVAANMGLQFGFRPNNVFTCGFWNNDLNTPASYTDLQWHHWVCTYDATTRLRTIYRDGAQVAQDMATANYSGSGTMYMGQRLDGNWRFQGALDEVGVWQSALPAAAVQTLYEKVKVVDESVLTCQLPAATGAQLTNNDLVLRQTTTLLGEISQSVDRTLTVDNDVPTAAISADYFAANGNPGYVSSKNTLVVAGEASDPSSYIAQVEVDAGNGWQTVAGAESWAYAWTTAGLSDGPQTLRIRATDAVGNVSAAGNWTTILDNTPPKATVQAPAGPVRPTRTAEGGWQVTLRGSVADLAAGNRPGSGVAAVDVLLQGIGGVSGQDWQPATLNADGTWQLDYLLNQLENADQGALGLTGTYSVTVRATDALSNTTDLANSGSVILTLDAAGPVITPSVALSNTLRITAAVDVGGTVADDSVVSAVEVNLTPGEQMGALDGVKLHLPFDERHATAYFADQSGSNHPATCGISQCPTVGEAGQRDRAVRFDGAGQYLTLPNILNPAETPFSAAVWFKVDALGKPQYILQQGDNEGTGRTWLALTATGEVHTFLGGSGLNSKTRIAPGGWHHAAVTYDGATLKLYVDGVLDTTSVRTIEASSGSMLVGANKVPNLFYEGLLDGLVIYDRALANDEVANLYAYGQGTWQPATLNGDTWRYSIPAGDDGLEGLYQLNVRGIDALGNVTPLGGQRVWRGEIDTRPPQLTFRAETDASGVTPTTTYTCVATDFNLVEESSCLPGQSPAIPTFRAGDRTLTSYATVDPWYAETITDTARLDRLDAVRTYPNDAVAGQTMTACDAYGNCSEVAESVANVPTHALDAEVLEPAGGVVLTSTAPVTVSGDVYAKAGLRALDVAVNGVSVHTQAWTTADVTRATWAFLWTPPGEGIYRFVPSIDDWAGETPPAATLQAGTAAPVQAAVPRPAAPPASLAEQIYLPWVAADASGTGGQNATVSLYLPLVTNGKQAAAHDYTGEVTTLYVDLTPPTIAIDAAWLTTTHELGDNVVLLTGRAADSVDLHRADVRIDGGPWQRAGLDGQGGWQWLWWFDAPPDGQSFTVTARATDVAGHTTTVTQTVQVDLVAPTPGEIALSYVNQAGEQLPVAPGDHLADATKLILNWGAASDAGGAVRYAAGFTTSALPAAGELTEYAEPGSHVQTVAADERWYATVRYMDAAGNTSTVTTGPFIIVK